MSRIRTIKPEFWTSEQVVACSSKARLLFIGLWNFCDDAGIHPASYIRLKAEVFPVDNFSIEEIRQWIDELITNNLLREYSVNDKKYWVVTGWKAHQKIDKPTYRHPLPQLELKPLSDSSTHSQTVNENSASNQLSVDDYSAINRRIIEDTSGTESNGMETKGKKKDICQIADAISPLVIDESLANNPIQEIFQHWQDVLHHPQAKLDTKRVSKIKQALKLGYSVDDLKKAIDGCANTPFNQGDNERKQRYDDITLILRDASHIETFIQAASNPPQAILSNARSDNFAGAI